MNEFELKVESGEFWDSVKEEFVYSEAKKLRLKHSLMSVAKWECLWHKSFFTENTNTLEEFKSYIKCMTLNGPFDDMVYDAITSKQMTEIEKYMNDEMTGSTFFTMEPKRNTYGRKKPKKTTAETIYFSMINLGIPLECERWHLNRLMAFIRFCEVSGGTSKKMSQEEVLRMYSDINSKRKAKHRARG